MRAPLDFPVFRPFITFYTPTYDRPHRLERCLRSVGTQRKLDMREIEHIVVPDHIGRGIGGMYQQVRHYAPLVRGEYVFFLCDDDALATETVVFDFKAWLGARRPEAVIVRVQKGIHVYPNTNPPWPAQMGHFDLGNLIVRRDVWREHCHLYGDRYEGDWDFAEALRVAGVEPVVWPVVFSVGEVLRGQGESR